MVNHQDAHSQFENNETLGGKHPNLNDLEDTEIKKISAIPKFILKILADDGKGTNPLNSKHRKVFSEVHT